MNVYCGNKNYKDSCKCIYCRKGRKCDGSLSRNIKKRARRKGKKEIQRQLREMRNCGSYYPFIGPQF